jgi:N-glycosylase/DNA lyase
MFSKNENIRVKGELDIQNILKTRTWLVENVKGIGYKEASHFLRNIGFGKDLAILDIHILKNLKKYGVTKDIPKTLTKIKYFEIENKLKIFSEKIRIPMSHLDLLFWSLETGKIFK